MRRAAAGTASSSAPDVLERLWRHGRIAHRICDGGMPEEVLEPPCVHSPGRQGVSGRMPQHVDMHRERQPRSLASPFKLFTNQIDAVIAYSCEICSQRCG